MRDEFQALWIATEALAALVIDLLLAGDIAVDVCEHDQVNGDGLAIEGHAPVATSAAIAGRWALPDPAPIHVNFDASQDLAIDVVPTTHAVSPACWMRAAFQPCGGGQGTPSASRSLRQ